MWCCKLTFGVGCLSRPRLRECDRIDSGQLQCHVLCDHLDDLDFITVLVPGGELTLFANDQHPGTLAQVLGTGLRLVAIDFHLAPEATDLLNLAGAVGVGEWRPEKNGTFGTFRVVRHIDDPKELAEVQSQCAVPLVGLRVPEWAMDQDIDPTILQKIVGQTAEEHHAIDESNEEESETLKEENPEALAGAHKALRSNGSNGQPSA